MDEKYTYYAFAYVENNPVKANMVENVQDYFYSSARFHLGLSKNSLLVEYDIGVRQDEYDNYLKSMSFQNNDILKCNTRKGLPCGSTGFVKKLGKIVGRDLSFKGVGRSKKG
ncbi:hypothetical protein [Bathymodiolus septemdierum thioautotrophic gill symbiont]|uniref:hypothetical protein n=1 Tax=Bathymodiolus septemdierum thioautotrophic gill symbiont TaxID=113267 RepID=UPI000824F679|nr:hypothetical protein [Bathymodiolus septemdierum thioautotrophic gill symbiont]